MNSARLVGFGLCAVIAASSAVAQGSRVEIIRTPNGGIQPQAVMDGSGAIHLIYFKGEAKGGDVFYVRQGPGAVEFTKPIQVNSQPNSAVAVGTIRGAQLALGRGGRPHVVWNGQHPKNTGGHEGAPLWYTRLNDGANAFEPQRDVMTFTGGLDGGGTVAADRAGNVYVMWHGAAPENRNGEAGRAVFLARSVDDGQTFARERPVNPKPTGACGCCGMRAFADGSGHVFALYRAASEKVNRDQVLMVSRNGSGAFQILSSHPWSLPTCPMSSAFISESAGRTLAAWETMGQVYFATIGGKDFELSKPVAPPGTSSRRKHPVAAANAKGETLLAWTEGTGWQKGGAVAWQVFDAGGQPTSERGRVDNGVPVWSLVAAVARTNGAFAVYH